MQAEPALSGAEYLLARHAETPEVAVLVSRVEQSPGALLQGDITSLRAGYWWAEWQAEPVTQHGMVFIHAPGRGENEFVPWQAGAIS